MDSSEKKKIDRREFLKLIGGGALATSSLLYGCNAPQKGSSPSITFGDVPKGKMTYRRNQITGDQISLLGFGFMRLPMKKQPQGEQEVVDQDAVNELVDYAIEHGVNYYDTSPMYTQGLSEKSMGEALSRHPRSKYLVATKLSNFSPDTQSRAASLEMYHESFKNLRVDYIDYYLLHAIGVGGMDAFKARYLDNGILDFLLEERKAGRIRNLGFSYHDDIKVYDYLLSLDIKWDFVQIQLNYVDWKHATEGNTNAEYLYGELTKRNIPAVIMEPLLGGRLAKLNDSMIAQLKQHEPNRSIASWAFRFAGTPKDVITVLSGMTFMEHLQDNIKCYSPLKPLTHEEQDMLEQMAQIISKFPNVPCTECNYCMPCPYGINIPGIFAHYNKCLNEGNVPKDAQDEGYRKARHAYLISYDRAIPRERQADHCIQCGKCLPHCPQKINIPEELERIDRFVEDLKQTTSF